ncbi:MAG: hypothetical protein H6707_18045 [Deltaproteobacteria bacterium]|nr:hypothetical protein [Deltaproteobacteria bacterium]
MGERGYQRIGERRYRHDTRTRRREYRWDTEAAEGDGIVHVEACVSDRRHRAIYARQMRLLARQVLLPWSPHLVRFDAAAQRVIVRRTYAAGAAEPDRIGRTIDVRMVCKGRNNQIKTAAAMDCASAYKYLADGRDSYTSGRGEVDWDETFGRQYLRCREAAARTYLEGKRWRFLDLSLFSPDDCAESSKND